MNFTVGDSVQVIDDNIEGEIIEIEGDILLIETSDGFPMKFQPKDLVKIEKEVEPMLIVETETIAEALQEKEHFTKKRKRAISKKKEKQVPPMEVDLHIEKLVPSKKGLSNHDILTKQLDTARGQLEFAIRKRIQKIVFIHGVGEGVLKAELEYLFSRYENVKFYDANYQKYGLGATEVYIFQNP
ncbi:Smr/MutS family protein [Zunongwangia pacifica]|uniref:DNA mismatch repair protein MutS n=1 Tax=Zunongwangia pacifica TaxID=2911062 RepID=A0A9X1ZVZ5_9FLAO|nr:Smr/MutS family protein [Zunongwangia pacifica]MCL6220210.1 DNA mismatch repair protein MutS [Zunongwangia pacifica]